MAKGLFEQLADVVVQYRALRRLSQIQLAVLADVSLSSLQGIEAQTKLPNVRTIMKVLDALDLLVLVKAGPLTEMTEEEKQALAERPPTVFEQWEGRLVTKEQFRELFPDMSTPEAFEFIQEHPELTEPKRKR